MRPFHHPIRQHVDFLERFMSRGVFTNQCCLSRLVTPRRLHDTIWSSANIHRSFPIALSSRLIGD
jgi:hypothetical protein